jgi:CTP:molybdopterin cytidylyltransferase MocA
MIESLRVGLRALPETAERALVVLGDQPQLSFEAARAP